MCDTRPGVRCSDHPRNKYKNKLIQSKKINDEIQALQAHKKSLPADSPELAEVNAQLETLKTKNEDVNHQVDAWEFEYAASPDGLKELKAAQDDPELSKIDRMKKEIDLEVANKRHNWQLNFSKILRNEEDGVRGVTGAIEAATFEKENIDLKLEKLNVKEEKIVEEINEKEDELAELEVEYRQHPDPKIKRKEKEVMTSLKFLRLALHKINKMKMLYGLISGDLDKFITSKSMKLFKNAAIGTAVLAVEFFAGVKKTPKPEPKNPVKKPTKSAPKTVKEPKEATKTPTAV